MQLNDTSKIDRKSYTNQKLMEYQEGCKKRSSFCAFVNLMYKAYEQPQRRNLPVEFFSKFVTSYILDEERTKFRSYMFRTMAGHFGIDILNATSKESANQTWYLLKPIVKSRKLYNRDGVKFWKEAEAMYNKFMLTRGGRDAKRPPFVPLHYEDVPNVGTTIAESHKYFEYYYNNVLKGSSRFTYSRTPLEDFQKKVSALPADVLSLRSMNALDLINILALSSVDSMATMNDILDQGSAFSCISAVLSDIQWDGDWSNLDSFKSFGLQIARFCDAQTGNVTDKLRLKVVILRDPILKFS